MNRGVKQSVYFDILTENKTVNVPGDFPTITAAFAAYARTFIPSDVRLTIKIAPGTHEFTEPLELAHPWGSQITIEGAEMSEGLITSLLGTYDWNKITFSVADATPFVGGGPVLIDIVDGSMRAHQFAGIYGIASVGAGTVDVMTGHANGAAFIAAGTTVTSARMRKFETVLLFRGCAGITVTNGKGPSLKNIAVLGDGQGGVTSAGIALTNGILRIDGDFGVTGFGGTGIYIDRSAELDAREHAIMSCGNLGSGVGVTNNGVFYAKDFVALGNQGMGFVSNHANDSEVTNGTIICGNVQDGINVGAARARFNAPIVGDNLGYGISAHNHGYVSVQGACAFCNTCDYAAVRVSLLNAADKRDYIQSAIFNITPNVLSADGAFIFAS